MTPCAPFQIRRTHLNPGIAICLSLRRLLASKCTKMPAVKS